VVTAPYSLKGHSQCKQKNINLKGLLLRGYVNAVPEKGGADWEMTAIVCVVLRKIKMFGREPMHSRYVMLSAGMRGVCYHQLSYSHTPSSVGVENVGLNREAPVQLSDGTPIILIMLFIIILLS
jgi:hypothetical protein